jgi:hypothetical protein
MAETQRGIARYAALALHDLRNAISGHAELTREFGCRDAKCFKLIA